MSDTIRIEAPAAQKELEFLKDAKVGDIRKSMLLPAIAGELKWACVWIGKKKWIWEARFLGQLVKKVEIVESDTALTLTEKEM